MSGFVERFVQPINGANRLKRFVQNKCMYFVVGIADAIIVAVIQKVVAFGNLHTQQNSKQRTNKNKTNVRSIKRKREKNQSKNHLSIFFFPQKFPANFSNKYE